MNLYFIRLFFDNIINILINFVFLKILLGIIIDSFGSFRDKLSKKISDQTKCCFICGIIREKLDKTNDS